jgi:hypothetical protein
MAGVTRSSTGSGYLQPAFLGGLVTGVLSALPIVSAGNLCCCLWVVTGGLLASYLLQQDRSDAITTGDGAIVGLLAGIFAAVISFVLSIPIGLFVGPVEQQVLERLRDLAGSSIPPGARFGFGDGSSRGVLGVVVVAVLGFFVSLIVGSIVSTLAGVVGAALFARKAPHAVPDDPDGLR